MLKAILALVLTRRPVVLLAVLAFLVAGMAAFSKLNIEAYPNPAPVILEITAQAPGLSAEEMERYYTRPLEIGLATTPGVDNIRSTSSYGPATPRMARTPRSTTGFIRSRGKRRARSSRRSPTLRTTCSP